MDRMASGCSKDGYDFAAALITSLVKAIVVAAITRVGCSHFVLLDGCPKVNCRGPSLLAPLTIGIGWVINYGIEALDKQVGKAWKGQ